MTTMAIMTTGVRREGGGVSAASNTPSLSRCLI